MDELHWESGDLFRWTRAGANNALDGDKFGAVGQTGIYVKDDSYGGSTANVRILTPRPDQFDRGEEGFTCYLDRIEKL